MKRTELAVGAGTAGVGLFVIAGATGISSEAGYAGVGPNFLPYVVGVMVLICGGFLVWEALSGGFRSMEEPSGAETADWASFAWMSAGILLNASLIEKIGFILSCALCFMLAVQGMRRSQGVRDFSARSWLLSALTGIAISAPVYWLFTKLLAINLPGLTSTGWL